MTTQKLLDREFILSFLAQFAFSSAIFVLVPTIPIYLSRLDAKGAEIGFLIGVLGVSSLIFRPFVGRALLRISEKRFMIAGAILYILTSIAYLLAPPFWPLLIVRVLQGVGLAFFSTASFTLIANITPETGRGRIISYYYLSINCAFALAPYFGMLLINRFNFTVLFLACAGLSLCSFFTTIKMGKREGSLLEGQSIQDQPILSREALPSSIMAFMLNIIWGTLSAFFPLYALNHGVSNPGIFFVFLAITLILGRALGGRVLDIYDREKVIVPCLIIVTIAITILIFSTTLIMFILVAVILGTGWALLYPSLMIYAIADSRTARGPAMGTFTALADLGSGIGPMIMGVVLQWTSYPIMFFCLTLISVINLFYFYGVVGKRIRILIR